MVLKPSSRQCRAATTRSAGTAESPSATKAKYSERGCYSPGGHRWPHRGQGYRWDMSLHWHRYQAVARRRRRGHAHGMRDTATRGHPLVVERDRCVAPGRETRRGWHAMKGRHNGRSHWAMALLLPARQGGGQRLKGLHEVGP